MITAVAVIGALFLAFLLLGVTSGPGYPSATSVSAPTDMSGRLRVGFSRNPKQFHYPKYVEYIEAETNVAYYQRFVGQEASRVINTQDTEWPDGQPDRSEEDGTEAFTLVPFITSRHSYKFRIGAKTAKLAPWPIIEQHSQIHAARCMTARALRMLNVATNPAPWQASYTITDLAGNNIADNAQNLSADHTNTATALVGGLLDQGTSTIPYLKNALNKIALLINADTQGVISSEPGKFMIIMAPDAALKIAASPEIHEYIKGSYFAREEIEKGLSPNGYYGLPSSLYGWPIIVEDTVVTTSRKGATLTRGTAMPTQTLLVVSRPGDLEGVYGGQSYSTLTMFWWNDEMTIEAETSSWDRLTYGRVVEDTSEQITCPASGYLLTAATS